MAGVLPFDPTSSDINGDAYQKETFVQVQEIEVPTEDCLVSHDDIDQSDQSDNDQAQELPAEASEESTPADATVSDSNDGEPTSHFADVLASDVQEPSATPEITEDLSTSVFPGLIAATDAIPREVSTSIPQEPIEAEAIAVPDQTAQDLQASDQIAASLASPSQQAWNAAIEDHDTVKVHTAIIDDPKISFQPPPHLQRQTLGQDPPQQSSLPVQAPGSLPPDTGFILTGSIKIFSIDGLTADFYSYHGPLPNWLDPDDDEPIYQMAVLRDGLKISSLLPSFAATKFDEIALSNVSFCFQDMPVDPTKPKGLSCSASMAIDPSYGQLHEILNKVLGFDHPSLNISCHFQYANDWHEMLEVPAFCLTGLFTDTQPQMLCKPIQISRVGASLSGITQSKVDKDRKLETEMAFVFSVFGSMHVSMPGCVVPLELDFCISEFGGAVTLQASLDGEWEHAFGVSQLTLDNISLEVDLDLTAPLDSLSFTVAATMEVGDTLIALEGSYSTAGDYSLTAYFGDLNVQGLVDLFVHFFDEEINLPDFDIHIGSATLTVAKDTGFELIVHDLRIGEHTATNGAVSIGSAGVNLKASITGNIINIEGVEIKNAFFDLSFGRKSAGTKTSVQFGGEVDWEGHQFDVAAHIYKGPDNEGSKLEYTVLGQFKTLKADEPLPFTTLVPALEDTFMKDIALREAALIIASREDTGISALTPVQYPIKKGIQVCAILDEIAPVKQMMGKDNPASLVLSAGWAPTIGFTLDILFPSPTTVHLGRGITTDPFRLEIGIGGIPKLMIFAGVKVPVEKQDDPLHFIVDLELDELGAAATGQLSTKEGWKNPFGISKQLIVGPDLALKIAIVWETFLEIGPSGFGFVGGLSVGKVAGQLAFDIEEVPSRELLSSKIERLDIQDVVSFASYVTSMDIVKPPNVVIFEEVSMYICPDGTTIGTLVYPPGFSFSSKVILFGIHADVSLSIGSEGVKAKGGIDNFLLGPLSVHGVNAPRASFDLELTESKQAGKVNGMIEFLGIQVTLVASFSFQPHFMFDFFFDLTFDGLFDFTVQASPVAVLTEDSHDVTKTDYKLTAELHEKIRGHMAENLNKMFDEKARQETQQAEHEKEDIENARKKWQADVDDKQAKLDAAYAVWTSKSTDMQVEHDRIVAEEDAKFATKQKSLDDAKTKLRSEVADQQGKLTAAQNDRASRIKVDEESLNRTQSEWDDKIAQKHRELDDATQAMHSGFGNAESNTDSAQQKVDSLQSDIDDIGRRISDCENADCWDLSAKAQIPVLEGERAGLRISKEVADGALAVAKAVLDSAEYVSCNTAMGAASLALDAAQGAGDLAIKGAKETLDATQKLVDGLVAAAESALQEASNLGQGAVDLASKALDDVKEASIAIREGAQKLLDDLKSCAEWVAYEAAKAALTVAKAAGSGAMLMAEAGVVVVDKVSEAALKAWQFVLQGLTSFIDITDVQLTAELGAAVGGLAFQASVRGVIGGNQFFGFDVSFDTKDVVIFLKDVFDKLVDLIENGILDGGKAVSGGIEQALE